MLDANAQRRFPLVGARGFAPSASEVAEAAEEPDLAAQLARLRHLRPLAPEARRAGSLAGPALLVWFGSARYSTRRAFMTSLIWSGVSFDAPSAAPAPVRTPTSASPIAASSTSNVSFDG